MSPLKATFVLSCLQKASFLHVVYKSLESPIYPHFAGDQSTREKEG